LFGLGDEPPGTADTANPRDTRFTVGGTGLEPTSLHFSRLWREIESSEEAVLKAISVWEMTAGEEGEEEGGEGLVEQEQRRELASLHSQAQGEWHSLTAEISTLHSSITDRAPKPAAPTHIPDDPAPASSMAPLQPDTPTTPPAIEERSEEDVTSPATTVDLSSPPVAEDEDEGGMRGDGGVAAEVAPQEEEGATEEEIATEVGEEAAAEEKEEASMKPTIPCDILPLLWRRVDAKSDKLSAHLEDFRANVRAQLSPNQLARALCNAMIGCSADDAPLRSRHLYFGTHLTGAHPITGITGGALRARGPGTRGLRLDELSIPLLPCQLLEAEAFDTSFRTQWSELGQEMSQALDGIRYELEAIPSPETQIDRERQTQGGQESTGNSGEEAVSGESPTTTTKACTEVEAGEISKEPADSAPPIKESKEPAPIKESKEEETRRSPGLAPGRFAPLGARLDRFWELDRRVGMLEASYARQIRSILNPTQRSDLLRLALETALQEETQIPDDEAPPPPPSAGSSKGLLRGGKEEAPRRAESARLKRGPGSGGRRIHFEPRPMTTAAPGSRNFRRQQSVEGEDDSIVVHEPHPPGGAREGGSRDGGGGSGRGSSKEDSIGTGPPFEEPPPPPPAPIGESQRMPEFDYARILSPNRKARGAQTAREGSRPDGYLRLPVSRQTYRLRKEDEGRISMHGSACSSRGRAGTALPTSRTSESLKKIATRRETETRQRQRERNKFLEDAAASAAAAAGAEIPPAPPGAGETPVDDLGSRFHDILGIESGVGVPEPGMLESAAALEAAFDIPKHLLEASGGYRGSLSAGDPWGQTGETWGQTGEEWRETEEDWGEYPGSDFGGEFGTGGEEGPLGEEPEDFPMKISYFLPMPPGHRPVNENNMCGFNGFTGVVAKCTKAQRSVYWGTPLY